MPALTPTYLMDVESRMQIIVEREYDRLLQKLWWQEIAVQKNTTGKRELLMWLLSTAQIRDQGDGGNIHFDDLVSQTTEIVNRHAGAGLKLSRDQLEDSDGGGLELAASWSADIGAQMAYWPQQETARLLKEGDQIGKFKAYTQKAFFAIDHPVNPYKTAAGVYANLLTGTASGPYPGKCPIDDSVTVDDALVNLAKVVAYVAGFKMPNGEQPRHLRPVKILCPPRMFPRVVQLTSAKFIAQAARSGGVATADVEKLVAALGFGMPIQCDELAGFENDTTYYVACEQITSSTLGGVVYSEREAFRINFYGVMDQAILNRADELEWHSKGRNVIAPGHPYLLIKCKGT